MTNRFVIADASKCIGCRTCEIACAVSHGDGSPVSVRSAHFTPRLKVVKSGSVTTPVMCRQCDNAPCASVCPTDAIIRNKNSIQIIQERCIGCKTCVVACPFGAMTVIHQQQKSQAMKCDLCINNPTGPACVSVCPTKAIRLIESVNLEQLVQDKQQRTALEETHSFLF